MDNKIGRASLRIAVIAVTIIFFFGAITYLALSYDKAYENREKSCEKRGPELTEELDRLMENRDYIDLNYYGRANNIYFAYDSQYRSYNDVILATDSFAEIYFYILGIHFHQGTLEDAVTYRAKSIASSIMYVNQRTDLNKMTEENYPDNICRYLTALREDMGKFLKYYLLMSDEDVEGMETLTENQLGVLIEEAIKNAW